MTDVDEYRHQPPWWLDEDPLQDERDAARDAQDGWDPAYEDDPPEEEEERDERPGQDVPDVRHEDAR